MRTFTILSVFAFSLVLTDSLLAQDRETKVRNDRKNVEEEGRWIYNDLPKGIAQAKKTGKPLGGKKRTAGLRLRATDAEWTCGDGPEVAGPGMDLILAISGRGGALDTCTGDGVAILRSRC